MRTIYLKNNSNYPFSFPYFYKVIEISENDSKVLTVTESSIEVEENDDFFETVSFIKNKLCRDTGSTEIKRDEFDAFYIKTVKRINDTINESKALIEKPKKVA